MYKEVLVLLSRSRVGIAGLPAGSAMAMVIELLISPSPIEFLAESRNLYNLPDSNEVSTDYYIV